MVLTALRTEVLDGLCSKERLDLMDSIDSLRSQGINHFVSLPQIIVYGDQSSGKSSVLEAISGVSFPVKSNLCTRFPTELVLRRTPQTSASVSIVPHHARSDSEKASLATFHEELENFEGLANLIDNAKSAMGISTHGKAFAKDLLRIEVSGPDRPHLTIVDLPGLIHSQTKHQSSSDVDLIQEGVEAYMREPRSIILAVVSAKNDFANQVVLKLARSADSAGTRTLGVITKPDTLHPGSESESLYVSLARNQEVEFRLGWHVLKNLDSEAGYGSLAQRDLREIEFFNRGIWTELPESVLGIDQLRNRLSKVLLNHITTELPSLIREIEAKRTACQERLTRLGQPRTTLHEQQAHLIGISELYQRLVQSAVNGDWNDLFFEDAESTTGYHRRIRAVVHNLNDQFAKTLSMKGHRRHMTDLGEERASKHCISVTRDEFVDHIENKMRRSRGRELPGLFHPMLVADLFRDQASPWEELARGHIRATWKACQVFLRHAIAHLADSATSTAIMHDIVQPAMVGILTALNIKTGELLRSHQTIHPITYNHYFTDTIQKIQEKREDDRVTRALLQFFHVEELGSYHEGVNLRSLKAALVSGTAEPDMHRFAASEALDHMTAYYKVAMKRFLDDIAVEVIEAVLMNALPAMLSPGKVFEMSPNLVTRIAGENKEAQAQRNQLMKQLEVLCRGAETCKQFAVNEPSGAEDSEDEEDEKDENEDEDDRSDASETQSAAVSHPPYIETSPSQPLQPFVEEPEPTVPIEVGDPVVFNAFWPTSSTESKKSKKKGKKVVPAFQWN
ncbi:interferon-induced GTP-binding protein Mx [Apiospora kogelbergensis]|uniref:Interferon-induced GTP-binding protein Mx n=1 Tax=Apiospora kogelbergensis TaxID=1337665 RepID=A0AAW0QS82_9PEZI